MRPSSQWKSNSLNKMRFMILECQLVDAFVWFFPVTSVINFWHLNLAFRWCSCLIYSLSITLDLIGSKCLLTVLLLFVLAVFCDKFCFLMNLFLIEQALFCFY